MSMKTILNNLQVGDYLFTIDDFGAYEIKAKGGEYMTAVARIGNRSQVWCITNIEKMLCSFYHLVHTDDVSKELLQKFQEQSGSVELSPLELDTTQGRPASLVLKAFHKKNSKSKPILFSDDNAELLSGNTSTNTYGLQVKYNVIKIEDGSIINNCFVLRPDKDRAAIFALRAYASATENKELATDIIKWVTEIDGEDEPITEEQLRDIKEKFVKRLTKPGCANEIHMDICVNDCGNCSHLSITEEQQNEIKKTRSLHDNECRHWCRKYNRRIWHGDSHLSGYSTLPRLLECIAEGGKND